MQELTQEEMSESAGGVVPVVGFVVAVAGHAAGFSGVGTWALSSASLITASYGLAEYLHNN